MSHLLPMSDQLHTLPRKTKKQRAAELLARIERGPAFDLVSTPDQAKELYRAWSESWIIDELKDLIPQLAKEKA